MKRIIILSCVLLFCLVRSPIRAQNIESFGKEKPVTISGGVSLNQILYGVNGIESRRDPYTYYASGNINFSIYGWSVPLSFSVSNRNTSFQQPFNQYSLHPTYKSITGHFGYTSMSYSPYTVSGHVFLGAGVDVAPAGKFKFSSFYGRLLKAVQPDSTNTGAPLPAFQRMGYGLKTTYGSGNDQVDVILFHAQDDPNSIAYVPEMEGILPQENLVVSLGVSKAVMQHFVLKAELASSAITRDIRSPEAEQASPLAQAKFLYTGRQSSSFYKAFKTSFGYQQDFYTIGVAYERVDPQYRTLGAYYFNNDLENITANGALAILQGKVNVSVNGGTQRDNLDHTKISTMRRLVGSMNLGYTPSQKLNFSGSYSNFQTYTNIRSQFVDINQLTPFDNLDTLNFTQISRNATLTTMYMFGNNESRRQNLNVNLMFQNAADKQGDAQQNSGARFYNINTAYSMSLIPQNMTLSASFNTNISQAIGMDTKTLGPTVALSKSFLDKKLRTTLSSSWNATYGNGTRLSTIANARVNGTYTVQKKHNLNLSVVVVNRNSKSAGAAKSFTEYTGTLGYSYAFGR